MQESEPDPENAEPDPENAAPVVTGPKRGKSWALS